MDTGKECVFNTARELGSIKLDELVSGSRLHKEMFDPSLKYRKWGTHVLLSPGVKAGSHL